MWSIIKKKKKIENFLERNEQRKHYTQAGYTSLKDIQKNTSSGYRSLASIPNKLDAARSKIGPSPLPPLQFFF